MTETNETFKDISIPKGLDNKQVDVARKYVTGRFLEGLTVTDTMKKHKISSVLYNENHLKNPVFVRYVNALQGGLAGDEIEDFRVIANKVKQDALKPNSTLKEKEMYFKLYDWVKDVTDAQNKEKHGLTSDNKFAPNTHEDNVNALLSRLKPNE